MLTNSNQIQKEDERELLERIAEGDHSAFSLIFNRYKQVVFNVGWTYTEDTGLAEDILQDVFVVIWKNRDKLLNVENLGAYIYTVARNRATKVLAKLRKIESQPSDGGIFQSLYQIGGVASLSEAEIMKFIYDALKDLSPQQRRAFELTRLHGLSREQAANQMGISKSTFSVHLTIALKRVRAILVHRLDIPMIFILLNIFFGLH